MNLTPKQIVDELGNRVLKLDRHVPRRVDLHPEEQIHQDIDSLGIQDKEPVADKRPSGESSDFPDDRFVDQFEPRVAFCKASFGIHGVKEADDDGD